MTESLETAGASVTAASYQQLIDASTVAMKFIFSWIILTPISVIVSGRLLAHRLYLFSGATQLFSIKLFGILNIEARDDEVILGFTGFLFTLLLVGGFGGVHVYTMFTFHFGVDPGQFNALCIFSALVLVGWTSIVYVLGRPFRIGRDARLKEEHDRKITQLADRHEVQARNEDKPRGRRRTG